MYEQSAIICLPDDRDTTGLKKPLMLQPMSGSPLLSWMVRLMRDSGYTRFLLSCDDEFRDAALACFPASAVTTAGPEPKASDLRAFLSQADDQLPKLPKMPVCWRAAAAIPYPPSPSLP